MIGSLLYLTTSTPDIMFHICLCARFHKEPREVHLTAFKRIFRYLIGISSLGMCFKKMKDFRLTSYYDVVLEINLKGKSPMQGVTLLVASWICKNRGSTALSNADAKYI